MNYTDTLINSLTESETNFDNAYNSYNGDKNKQEVWNLFLSWVTSYQNWSFKEFRDNTNIDTVAKSLWNKWTSVFDIIYRMLEGVIKDGNVRLATAIYEKAMEMANTACTYSCGMDVSPSNKNNIISNLKDEKEKIDSLVFTNNNLHTILNNAIQYAERDQVYQTFNFNKLGDFAKRYNLGTIDINNECLVKVVKKELLKNPRFMHGEVNITHISIAVATMYLTILAALNIFTAFEGILKDTYKCFIPDDPQPYFNATWLDGLTGNIKVGSDQYYYNLKFHVSWYKPTADASSTVSYNAFCGFRNLFERDYTSNTLDRPFKFSELLCGIDISSTRSSSHDYDYVTKGAYNINLFKQSIEHLIKDIKSQGDNKVNEI